ncbi:MAG TPA: arginine N-succinyltransferase [Kofleriaceae bacterium]|nr:arginine N-succinyltransferase [Kofleriaceae bacterium]
MFQIRPSRPDDLEQVLAVARHLDSVNLPADRDHLERILDRSAASFAGTLEASERELVFVLEDKSAGCIAGTSMIHAQHGTRRAPHIYFQILKDERYSETLDRYFVHQCLRLGYNYDGPTELGGLILLPAYRRHTDKLGRLLSFVRFVFIAMHRAEFRDRVIAELLPPLENDRTSVLWEHLGKKFTGLTYQEADLKSKYNKEFIRSLFPHEPIYVALLPDAVKRVIGKAGPETRGVETMLCGIGFRFANQIDPFDGGPHFVAATDDITLVKGTHRVTCGETAGEPEGASWMVVAAEPGDAATFRATAAWAEESAGQVMLSAGARDAIEVSAGDPLWVVKP